MRLFDQIAHGAVGEAASRLVREAALRYIIDVPASRLCFDLIRAGQGLLDPDNPLLRVSAELFWVEWQCEPEPGCGSEQRLGVLVEAAPGGRAGTLTPFWQQRGQAPQVSTARLVFDLERTLHPPIGFAGVRKMRHGGMPHLDRLFDRMLWQFDAQWRGGLQALPPGEAERQHRSEAEATWFYLPLILAFSILLASRDAVEERPADLTRLNRARERRGRIALLDHVEVGMRLGRATGPASANGNDGGRQAPRLHFVRGHPVHRGDKTFWRAPHLRGDPERPIVSKTVRVTG